jgi:hypothetical protein
VKELTVAKKQTGKARRGRTARPTEKSSVALTERVDFRDLHKELNNIWTILEGVRVRKGKAVPPRLLGIIQAVETLQDETECQINMLLDL